MHFQPGQLLSTIAEKKAVVSFESIKSLYVNVHALPCHFCFFSPSPILSSMQRYKCGFTPGVCRLSVVYHGSNRTKQKTICPPHKLFSNNWGEKERQAVAGAFPIISFFLSLSPAKAKHKLLPRDASALSAPNCNQMLSLSLLKIRKLIIGHIFKHAMHQCYFCFILEIKHQTIKAATSQILPPW